MYLCYDSSLPKPQSDDDHMSKDDSDLLMNIYFVSAGEKYVWAWEQEWQLQESKCERTLIPKINISNFLFCFS